MDEAKRTIVAKINEAKSKLSALLNTRSQLENNITDLNTRLSNNENLIEYAAQSLSTLESNLANLPDYNTDGIVVSDHAIVRYLQRFHNIDIDKIKDTIVDDYLESYIIEHRGNGKFHNSDSTLKAVVVDGVIVTVMRGVKYKENNDGT